MNSAFKRIVLPAVFLACAVAAGSVLIIQRMIETDPAVIFLQPENGAQWIRLDRPFALRSWRGTGETTEFRTTFQVETSPAEAVFTLRAFRQATLFLDGELLTRTERSPNEWKQPVRIDPGPGLQPGRHELRVVVTNDTGPALLLAYGPGGLPATGSTWEARRPSETWRPAQPVDVPGSPPDIVRKFPSSLEGLRHNGPLLALIFTVVFAVTAIPSWNSRAGNLSAQLLRHRPGASDLKWALIGLWVVLSINSLLTVPRLGFDAPAHLDYITYMTENIVPPLATDGWQMFQTPLYYMLSAWCTRLLTPFFEIDTIERLLRVIPLLCGLGQIEICYRALKRTFPEREALQSLGLLLVGLLPMNLYMSQHLGNEPLAGVLSALVVLGAVRCLNEPGYAAKRKTPWLLGLWLGLAILTKVTAVLLIVPVLFCLATARYRENSAPAAIFRAGFQCALVIGLLTGWYFARNWIELGRLYVGGWDISRGIIWWQDPGFRTADHFTSFGRSLVEPVYAARFGFWDAIYSSFWLDGFISGITDYSQRPPWNDRLMLCAPWLAILPTAAILFGLPAAWQRSNRPARLSLLFAAACLAIYFAAMLALYLKLPIYSTAKASYTLGLLPCYAMLGAAGFGVMFRNRLLRGAVYGWMACWAVFSYLAYFAF